MKRPPSPAQSATAIVLCPAELPYEIVVADNGSSDGSVEIARLEGARVVLVYSRGYGAALRAGIQETQGCFVLMGDSDSTYRFDQAPLFLAQLHAGADLVRH